MSTPDNAPILCQLLSNKEVLNALAAQGKTIDYEAFLKYITAPSLTSSPVPNFVISAKGLSGV